MSIFLYKGIYFHPAHLLSSPPSNSFILNQSQSLSVSYDSVVRAQIGLDETEAVFITNLPVFPLHYLKVTMDCYYKNPSIVCTQLGHFEPFFYCP